jgi:hypothetical protein
LFTSTKFVSWLSLITKKVFHVESRRYSFFSGPCGRSQDWPIS